jgi:hypothetical protein
MGFISSDIAWGIRWVPPFPIPRGQRLFPLPSSPTLSTPSHSVYASKECLYGRSSKASRASGFTREMKQLYFSPKSHYSNLHAMCGYLQLYNSSALCPTGPFTAEFRIRAVKAWGDACQALSIPCAASFKLLDVLGDPLQVRIAVLYSHFETKQRLLEIIGEGIRHLPRPTPSTHRHARARIFGPDRVLTLSRRDILYIASLKNVYFKLG